MPLSTSSSSLSSLSEAEAQQLRQLEIEEQDQLTRRVLRMALDTPTTGAEPSLRELLDLTRLRLQHGYAGLDPTTVLRFVEALTRGEEAMKIVAGQFDDSASDLGPSADSMRRGARDLADLRSWLRHESTTAESTPLSRDSDLGDEPASEPAPTLF